ncbi:unnamed protein product [Ilex paraguariensis]|uniref:RNase H type-1 domain-containing protein n=1 Tax=Ilex paraguariensis TaxID=185542 RepID=A0ABC8UW33_9AQUA
MLIFWALWKGRCRRRFEGLRLNALKWQSYMIKPKKEEGRAGTDMLQDLRIYPPFSVTTKVKCMNWEPPAINKVKLNFDGTSKQNGLSSGGMILRDSKGHVLLAAAAAYGIGSNMKAECLALLDALKMIMHHGLGTSQLVLESDSQVLVNVALGVVEVPWRLSIYMEQILDILEKMNYHIRHV